MQAPYHSCSRLEVIYSELEDLVNFPSSQGFSPADNFLQSPDNPSLPPLPTSTLSRSPSWMADLDLPSQPVPGVIVGGEERDNMVEMECHLPPPPLLPHPTPEIQPVDKERDLMQRKVSMTIATAVVRNMITKAQDYSSLAHTKSRDSNASQMGSKAPFEDPRGEMPLMQVSSLFLAIMNGGGGRNDVLSAAVTQNSDVQSRSTSEGSFREQLNYKEHQGVTDTIDSTNPIDAKHMRRKLQNREAARRSRRKKKEKKDESKVPQYTNALALLSKEYDELCKRRKKHEAELKAFNAKVKMGEEAYRRSSTLAAAVTIQDEDQNHSTRKRIIGNTAGNIASIVDPSSARQVHRAVAGGKMRRTHSLQRVDSLDHHCKRARHVPSSSEPLLSDDDDDAFLQTILFMN